MFLCLIAKHQPKPNQFNDESSRAINTTRCNKVIRRFASSPFSTFGYGGSLHCQESQ
jgi:hypothetical protein